jgi:hypothetical protein
LRTLLLLLLFLRLAMEVPFQKGLSMGREVLRGWRNHSAVATLAILDVDSSHFPR